MYNAKWSPQEIATWWNRSIESEETRDAFPHFEKGRIGYVFNATESPVLRNIFLDPNDTSGQTNRYDGVVTSSDELNVLWDVAEINSMQSPPTPTSPPSTASPPPSDDNAPSSLRFDGIDTSAFINVGGSTELDFNQELTFEAWIKPERFGEQQVIAMRTGGDYSGWSVAIMCPAGAGPGCCGDHVDGALGFVARTMTSSDCIAAKSAKTPLRLGEWQHVAVVVDAPQADRRRAFLRRRCQRRPLLLLR